MKKNTQGFSFIEILIVVMLMTIITSTGIYYFQDFLQKQESNIHIQSLHQKIELLDKSVQKKEIFDYTVTLKENYSIISENNFGGENSIRFTKNGENSGYFSITPIEQDKIFQYKIYENNKKIIENNVTGDSSIPVNISQGPVKIMGKLGQNVLNNLKFGYHDSEKLLEIQTIVDNNNNSINSLVIQNIGGVKKIKNGQNGNILDTPVEIIFDYKGFQNTLILD